MDGDSGAGCSRSNAREELVNADNTIMAPIDLLGNYDSLKRGQTSRKWGDYTLKESIPRTPFEGLYDSSEIVELDQVSEVEPL